MLPHSLREKWEGSNAKLKNWPLKRNFVPRTTDKMQKRNEEKLAPSKQQKYVQTAYKYFEYK